MVEGLKDCRVEGLKEGVRKFREHFSRNGRFFKVFENCFFFLTSLN
jgi:hypothetical protein